MASLVDDNFLRSLDHLERERILTEPQVLGRDEAVEKDVDTFVHIRQVDLAVSCGKLTFTDGVGHRDDAVDGWLSVKTADEVGEIVKD